MDNLPQIKRQHTFDQKAFLMAQAKAVGVLELAKAQQAGKPDEPGDDLIFDAMSYLRSILSLSNMKVKTGIDIPEPKERLHLYLSEGKRSITASRYSRLNVCFSIDDSDRIIGHHGTALTSISKSSDPFSLWDTEGKGKEISKHPFSPSTAPDLSTIISVANELLMHSIPRLAEEFSSEYDVEITAPVFIQTQLEKYGDAKALSVAGLDMGPEECSKVEQAFKAIQDQAGLLYLLMKNATLAQWVKTAVDDNWCRRDWDLAVERAGANDDPDFSEGWAAVELVIKCHNLKNKRYGDRWTTEIPSEAEISSDTNWNTAREFISSLTNIRPGWDGPFDLGRSEGPWTFPIEMVNAAIGIGVSRAYAAKLGLELSDSELLVMGTTKFTMSANGELTPQVRLRGLSVKDSPRDRIAFRLATLLESKLKTRERPAVYPPDPDENIYSNEASISAPGLSKHAHLARATIVQHGAQTAQRELLARIKRGDVPQASGNGVLPLDHPVWTLLAAKAHNEHSRRALRNLAEAGCVNANNTTPEGTSLLDFAIIHGGVDSIREAEELGSKSKNLLWNSMLSGNPDSARALLEKGWHEVVGERETEALVLAKEAGGEVHARISLEATKADLDNKLQPPFKNLASRRSARRQQGSPSSSSAARKPGPIGG